MAVDDSVWPSPVADHNTVRNNSGIDECATAAAAHLVLYNRLDNDVALRSVRKQLNCFGDHQNNRDSCLVVEGAAAIDSAFNNLSAERIVTPPFARVDRRHVAVRVEDERAMEIGSFPR